MPELPEVETVRRSLEPRLVGDLFSSVVVRDSRLREPVDAAELERRLVGREVLGLRRRAKYLLADVAGGSTLVVHLGMSGRLTLVPEDAPREPHEHVTLGLRTGRRLRLRDPRRFGLVFAGPTATLALDRHFAHLGAEPLDDGFDGELLARAAGGRRGPVKTFLMDGRVVVGVGNIYASEALHRAGIHPRRSVARLAAARWDRLAAACREVLGQAIEQGGTTLNDFTDANGEGGWFQVALRVYDRAGRPCPRCGRPVRRIVQSNRSTFYCPGCQT